MSHDLLMELSDEQQELVAGGGQPFLDYASLYDSVTFEDQLFARKKTLVANGKGAGISTEVLSRVTKSNAYETDYFDYFHG